MYREFPPAPEPAHWVVPASHPQPGMVQTVLDAWLASSIYMQVASAMVIVGVIGLGILAIREMLKKQ